MEAKFSNDRFGIKWLRHLVWHLPYRYENQTRCLWKLRDKYINVVSCENWKHLIINVFYFHVVSRKNKNHP